MPTLGAHLGRRLGDEARELLLAQTDAVDFAHGEQVIWKGKPVDGLLWIAEGSLHVVLPEHRTPLSPLAIGELVGCTGAMTGGGTTNVYALGEVRCLFLSLSALEKSLRDAVLGPVLVDLLLEHFAQRLRSVPTTALAVDTTPEPGVTLADHPALAELDAGRRELLTRIAVVEKHEAGHRFTRAGDQATAGSSHGWLLLAGEVEEDERDGHVHRVAQPGDGFGFVALVDDGPRESTCTARTPVTVAKLDRAVLRELHHHAPDADLALRLGLTRMLARDLADRLELLA